MARLGDHLLLEFDHFEQRMDSVLETISHWVEAGFPGYCFFVGIRYLPGKSEGLYGLDRSIALEVHEAAAELPFQPVHLKRYLEQRHI